MSIRYKIAGALILVLVLAIASLGMVTFSHQKRILEEEIKKRAGVFAHQLAEARFGRVNVARKCWAPRGTRPCVGSQIIREYTYAYAAVSPVDGMMDSL